MSGAQGDDARGVVIVVLMGAEHQVCREMQGREAWDIIVLIGVEDTVKSWQVRVKQAWPCQRRVSCSMGKPPSLVLGPWILRVLYHISGRDRGSGKKLQELTKNPGRMMEKSVGHSIMGQEKPACCGEMERYGYESSFGDHGRRYGFPLWRRETDRRHWPPWGGHYGILGV